MRPGERAARAAAYERARPEILEHVPATARRVLDVGCATGATGAAGLQTHHVTRRPWLLWRGSRLDALAPPLLRVPGLRTLVCFQHVLAARPYPGPGCR
jgi:hypothetical protein